MAKLMKDFVRIENNFTIIPNEILRNKEMKSSTKNILLTMFGLPSDWDFSIAGISTCVYEGYETVQKSLVELEKMGYITRKRQRRENGTLGAMIYTIHQFPVSEEKNTYKKNFSDQDVKKPKQVKTNIGKNQNREEPIQDSKRQLRKDNKSSTDDEKRNDDEDKNLNKTRTDFLADTLKQKDVLKPQADTPIPKKQLPMRTPKKKTRSELKELESYMIDRFSTIASQYELSDTCYRNTVKAFKHYLDKYTERTSKVHPILSDNTLEKIFETLAMVNDTEYGHFEKLSEIEPGENENSYLDALIDEHFRSKHEQGTDWHISHFASVEYLEKMAQHVVDW